MADRKGRLMVGTDRKVQRRPKPASVGFVEETAGLEQPLPEPMSAFSRGSAFVEACLGRWAARA